MYTDKFRRQTSKHTTYHGSHSRSRPIYHRLFTRREKTTNLSDSNNSCNNSTNNKSNNSRIVITLIIVNLI